MRLGHLFLNVFRLWITTISTTAILLLMLLFGALNHPVFQGFDFDGFLLCDAGGFASDHCRGQRYTLALVALGGGVRPTRFTLVHYCFR